MIRKQLFQKYSDCFFFLLGLVPIAIMLFVKCRYGFANRDESFYLTTPYRLWQGDALFLNEWHLSQMTWWILQLPMALFLRLNGSTDGIYLAFRYLYVILHLCGSTLLFLLLRRKSRSGAVIASLFYLIYDPFCVSALSYNTMGLEFLMLSTALITCGTGRKSAVAGGILLALAVLCCPYLAVLFPIYGCAVLIGHFFHAFRKDLPFLLPGRFGWFTLGISVPAVLFLASVLPRIPLSAWPQILSGLFSDPEHNLPLKYKFTEYEYGFRNNRFLHLYVALLVCGLLVRQKEFRALLGGVILAFSGFVLLHSTEYINYLMFPLNMAGLYFYLIYPSASTKPLFYGIWIPGAIYSFCLHCASNQRYLVVSSAFAVSLVASVLIIILTLKEQSPNFRFPIIKYGLVCAAVLVFLLQGALLLSLRWNAVFWENGISEQTQLLTAGTHKGLLVSPEREKAYLEDLALASHLDSGSSLLVFGKTIYFYLLDNHTNSCYSGWCPSALEDSKLARLELYYKLCPEKQPDQVLIQNTHSKYIPAFLDSGKYTLRYTSPQGDVILDRIR